ncbi:hypothetical protein Tco_1218783 [Tanacetum coccineum]
MENANPSISTPNSEFLDPKKKLEIESWLEDSKIVNPLVSSDDMEYFDTFPTLEELGYHEWLLKYPKPSWVKANIRTGNLNNIKISCMIGLDSRQKPSNPSKNNNFVGRVRGLKVFIGNFTYECNFMILEHTTSTIDHYLGELVFGKPFVIETGLVYDQEEGTVVFQKNNEKITYKIPHKTEMFNHIDFKDVDTNSTQPFVLKNNDNHGKPYYSDSRTLGPEYRKDESISKEIRHLMKLEREARRNKGEVTLYLMRRSLEVLTKFHWMILGGRFNQLSHVSSPLLSKPGEY